MGLATFECLDVGDQGGTVQGKILVLEPCIFGLELRNLVLQVGNQHFVGFGVGLLQLELELQCQSVGPHLLA